jgi:hypothetical protein
MGDVSVVESRCRRRFVVGDGEGMIVGQRDGRVAGEVEKSLGSRLNKYYLLIALRYNDMNYFE